MKRRQYLLLLATTVIAGLVGGAVSNHLMVRPAAAQNLTAHGNITSLKAFRLVDENELLRAVLELSDGEPSLKFFDRDGAISARFDNDGIWTASGTGQEAALAPGGRMISIWGTIKKDDR